jgi:hypothetical protein
MSDSPNFAPGKRLPTLGVFDKNSNSWKRWGLPLATGLVIALVTLALI